MFTKPSQGIREKLWPHQIKAIDFAVKHLNQSDAPCLIRMPTGTGKTGIIAYLTRLAHAQSSLVLTPWANLREQMVKALEAGFWSELKIKPGKPTVIEMLPSDAKDILKDTKPQVIVATFTTLNELRREHEATYAELAKYISLVIADECHYEPAVQWGKSVTRLKVRTVLLTATPYRNDLKLFRISDAKNSTQHFTHKEAVSAKIIRELDFERLSVPCDIPKLATAFSERWTDLKRHRLLPSGSPRAIICCSGAADIEETVNHLKRRGLSAIGFHDQFEKSTKAELQKAVPDPYTEPAEIWVHQHKLTEGLDDHRFCCVALFTRIRNDRKLIQQIGRVLRRRPDDLAVPALLLAPAEYAVEDEWDAYRQFETDLTLLEPVHFRHAVERLLGAQPPVEYFEGKFRKRFDVSQLGQKPQVIIPPSVLVRTALKDFSLDEYIEDCTDTLNTEDAVILGPQINAPCQRDGISALWVYASVRNSRLLESASLYEIQLETHCIVVAEGYVLIADSRGIVPREYLDDQTSGVSPERLARFLDDSFRPTHVSVDSSIPYETVLRGADLHGYDILQIPPSLTDRIQICRSARGASKDHERRYVGMSNGRLRKEETAVGRRSFEPNVFIQWAQKVARILNSNVAGSLLFQRFMPTCAPPNPTIPKTICVDLLRLNLQVTLSDGRACSLKGASVNIEASSNGYLCAFEVKPSNAKAEPLTLKMDYDSNKRRFWFKKDKGPSVHIELTDDPDVPTKNLAEFLNQHQDLVLIGLEGGETVYQGRHFYRIDYSYAERALLDLLESPRTLSRFSTEKGTKAQIQTAKQQKASTFPSQSIFKGIAEGVVRCPFAEELLICADMGTECADFVAASFKTRELSLIHAKAGSGTGISATAFHEVVAQAMKNLVYLTRNADVPQGVNAWEPGKRWNKTGVPRILRAPRGLPTQAALWKKIRSEILDDSNPQLYVTLVTAGCCRLKDLKEAVEQPSKRTPETAQLLHLLDGLNSYARQLGIRVKIYDLPFEAP